MPERTFIMSKKELDRLSVIKSVVSKRLTQKEAAKELQISDRQVRYLLKRYKSDGEVGLISRRRGKPSNNRVPKSVQDSALELIKKYYRDFGPTLAHEKLVEEYGFSISRETVRKIMVDTGVWNSKKQKRKQVFQMRDRRSRIGELIQIDGSPHDWFEGRSESCTLIVFIDDANGELKYLRFIPQETTNGYMDGLKSYIKSFGRPVSFYSDRHSIFRINIDEPKDGNTLTQFGRALKTLDIECIHARTPQAKGRVERANKTLQDRLVKEMRLKKINTMEEGNAFLDEYMVIFNHKFSVTPKSPEDANRKLYHNDTELNYILAKQHERKLSKNLICQFKNTQYQIQTSRSNFTLKGATVTVCEYQNNSISILRKGKELSYNIFNKNEQPSSIEDEKSLNDRVDRAIKSQNGKPRWKPKADHPWRGGTRYRGKASKAVPSSMVK